MRIQKMNENPFDFLNSINTTKINLIRDEGRGASEYAPYLMNRGLSQFSDTIMYANEMNIRWHTDKQMQYEFLLHSIRPRKRVSKWAKKEDVDITQIISELFGCSIKKAEEVRSVLGSRTIEEIIKYSKVMHGGILNAK
jgi:hypothetical protein